MQILAIELENAKSYDSAKIEFTDGVNAIVGHNGAGKSTILEGIGLAVFDTLDYRQTDFVRGGAKYAEVRVTIVSKQDGRPYQVVRRVGSSNQHFVYDTDAQLKLCEGKADVVRFLRQHLGVDPTADLPALFRDAVGVPQGTFTAAFLMTPEKRKGVFDSLLQVEEYKKAFEKLLEPVKTLRDRRAQVAEAIAGLRGRLEWLPGLEATLAQRQIEIAAAECKLRQAKEKLDEVGQARSIWESVREEVNGLQKLHAQLTQRLSSAQSQLASAQQALAEAHEAAATVTQHQAGHDRYLQLQAEQQRLEARAQARQQLDTQAAAADKALALADAELQQVQAELEKVVQAEAAVVRLVPQVAEQEELERALDAVRQQQARLREVESAAQQRRGEVQQLENRLATLTASLARAPEIEAQQRAAQAEIDTARQASANLAEQKVAAHTKADALKKQTATLQDAATALCPVCEQPLTATHRRELLARNEESLADLRAKYAEAAKAERTQEEALKQAEATLKQIEHARLQLPRAEEAETTARDLAATHDALHALETQIAQLAAGAGQAGALQQALQALGDPRHAHTVAKGQAERRPALESRGQAAQTQQASLQATLAGLAVQLGAYAGLDAETAAVKSETQRTQPAYAAVLANMRLAAALGQRSADATGRATELAQVQQETAANAAQLADAEARFDRDAFLAATALDQQLRRDIGALHAELEMLSRAQAKEQTEVAALVAMRTTLDEQEGRARALKAQEEGLETIRTLLRDAGPHITKVLVRQISENARQIYSELMQDYTRHLTWREDYGVTLEVDGYERQFAQLSGGEQMSAALAVRLALLRELTNIDVAFFDEPTANLDEDRRDALARQILQVKGFRQLFVISHDDTFEQATQNLIRVERIGGISRVEYG